MCHKKRKIVWELGGLAVFEGGWLK